MSDRPPESCVIMATQDGKLHPIQLCTCAARRHVVPSPSATFTSRRRSTPAYLGQYIRASESIASSSLHYAFSGVSSPAPPLQGRIGVFHHRAAPPHRPVQASPSLRTISRSCTSSRLRPVSVFWASRWTVCGATIGQAGVHLRFCNDYMYSGTGATTTSSRSPFPGSSEVVRGTIFLSPIEFGSASSKLVRKYERDRCPTC